MPNPVVHWEMMSNAQNAVWTYEQPYNEMLAIKGLLAFSPDRVDSISAG